MPYPFLLLALVSATDLAPLAEALQDRHHPRAQHQAALRLVQSREAGAEKVVRQGLRRPDNEEMFLALAAAIRLERDDRFLDDLLAALLANKPRTRHALAEALAALPSPALVTRLDKIVRDESADLRVRQTALWALGRSGRHAAGGALVGQLGAANEDMRRVAAAALTELTGLPHGGDAAAWRGWWAEQKDIASERWLAERLAQQTARARRLEGELARARTQTVRLHQQLYQRLTPAERLTCLAGLPDHEDAAVRGLAIGWGLELLPAAEGERRKQIAKLLLRLTHDDDEGVQRAAVLALGRVGDAGAERLRELAKGPDAALRAAAVRVLAEQARSAPPAAAKEVVGLLQKALDDKALEVVVEAAEGLGAMGAKQAGPVLTGLLRHPSGPVRRAAASALERTADAGLLDGLLRGLDDENVNVRFSLVGALARSAGGTTLAPEAHRRVRAKLEALLKDDPDAGVRGRAATVLGECGGTGALEALWRAVQTSDEGRVAEQAWGAFVDIIVRAESAATLERWDRLLTQAKQGTRRVELLSRAYTRWGQNGKESGPATKALAALVQARVELGQWQAAAPQALALVGRTAEGDELRERALGWLLRVGEGALKEGRADEAARLAREAGPYVGKHPKLGEAFARLGQQAREKK